MLPKVKICGITTMEDAFESVRMGADALGFIFYENSRRFIPPDRARAIVEGLPPSIMTVGVFVNAQREFIQEVLFRARLHALQFSGDEPPASCRGYVLPVIKALRVRSQDDLAGADRYTPAAFLLDGFRDGEYGGTGERVDAGLARAFAARHRVILAGGLTPENVAEAVEHIRPWAIDVNSGVESTPGKKDPRKLKALFHSLHTLHHRTTGEARHAHRHET